MTGLLPLPSVRLRFTLGAVLSLGLLAGCASPDDPNCPAAGAALSPSALYGEWEVRIGAPTETPPALRVQLQPHPEYAGVRGQVLHRPGTPPAQLAGDINDEGRLQLDESADGRSISATWDGELQPRSCGQVFHGQWRRAGADQGQPFVLTRLPKPTQP